MHSYCRLSHFLVFIIRTFPKLYENLTKFITFSRTCRYLIKSFSKIEFSALCLPSGRSPVRDVRLHCFPFRPPAAFPIARRPRSVSRHPHNRNLILPPPPTVLTATAIPSFRVARCPRPASLSLSSRRAVPPPPSPDPYRPGIDSYTVCPGCTLSLNHLPVTLIKQSRSSPSTVPGSAAVPPVRCTHSNSRSRPIPCAQYPH